MKYNTLQFYFGVKNVGKLIEAMVIAKGLDDQKHHLSKKIFNFLYLLDNHLKLNLQSNLTLIRLVLSEVHFENVSSNMNQEKLIYVGLKNVLAPYLEDS